MFQRAASYSDSSQGFKTNDPNRFINCIWFLRLAFENWERERERERERDYHMLKIIKYLSFSCTELLHYQ